jgi:hypothetical protein
MKVIIQILILFLFLSFKVNSQNRINNGLMSQSNIMFNDTVRAFGSGGDGFAKVIEDSNSYFALSFLNSSAGQYPYLLELDSYGNLIKKKIFIKANYNYAIYPYNSMILKDSTLLFCGQKWGTQGSLGFVLSVNKYTFDTLWEMTYYHPDTILAQTASDVFSVLTSIKPTPEGGYILTGNYNKDCITGNLRSFLMKIDNVGNVLWRKTYSNISSVFNLEFAPNGRYSFINKFGGTSFVLTDSIGNILLNKVANNYTGRATSGDLKYTGNNSFVVSTPFMYNSDYSHPLFGVNIFKINILTQQVLWDKTYILYSNFDCISLHQAMGVEILPNGDIIVSGTAKNYGHDAVILKLNSNGDSLWCKSYDFGPDPWDCQLNDLIITEDGGYMGVGFFSDQSGPGWTAWMFKTDSNGYVGMKEYEFAGKKQLIKVYPNPAQDQITIDIGNRQMATIELYNSAGQRITSSEYQVPRTELNISKLSSGLYFGRVVFKDGVTGSFKFIKE